MNENMQKWLEKIKSAYGLITHRKTVKGARITYNVVWNLVLLFLIILLVGGTFAGAVGAGYFASMVKDEPIRPYDSMKKDIYNYTETSELYFANNVFLGKLRTDLEREEVKLDQVSKYLTDAVIATEDEYFYKHDGVVPKAILRALFQEVSNASVQSGGSTLTQQLIKNQILTNEVSFERKAKEILLALRLEKFFDKKEILEAYLNVSTFGRNSSGRNVAGVQAAAKGIFGVSAKDLNLAQAAFIAGLPQSPFGYTPFTNKGEIKTNLEPGQTRMKVVLKRMLDGGYINEKQYSEAINYDLKKDFVAPGSNPLEKYPWLTMEVEKRAIETLAIVMAEKEGVKEKTLRKNDALFNEYLTIASRNLRQNGYQIHTTIDKDILDAMEKVKNEYPHFGPDKPQEVKDPETGEIKTIMEPVEVGAILIENKTGKIISFVAGRDYQKEQLNHATSAVRQNGSTMKPLLVYGPAIELGKASPGTILPDVALRLAPGLNRPWPMNYDKRYSGLTSARHALAKSYNVPAVKLYKDIIGQRPASYLEKMGFTSLLEEDYTNLATAIGSLKNGVTVEENTNAFGTFANDGKFIDAYMIDKITDKKGNIIYQHKVDPVDVFSPQTAYLTIDMMRDVINRGTATSIKSRLKFQSDWAGKTGTGVDFHDAWFVATNPNVSFGIWTGYDTPKSLKSGGLSYSLRANYLWADLMNAAYDIKPELVDPAEGFKMPGGIVRRSYCAVSGLLPSEGCTKAGMIETDIFNAKFVPTKVDDSLIAGNYVRIGDKNYLALDSTPKDFAQQGLIFNPDFVKWMTGTDFKDLDQLIPKKERWGSFLTANAKIEENGKAPAPVSVTATGNSITWTANAEKDIIGYRIYNNGSKVASINAGSKLTMTVGNGSVYVTAVDIAGNESAPSNKLDIGAKPPETPVTPPVTPPPGGTEPPVKPGT
ncbi:MULTISPECIES: transglycosylase domain-containing protein [unclassified Bacillus (in: firmicutes)]|uniref:transglycosylase domain-containing protein n=1 Tax=unclassified Bacillus (in: firmicutes) TaxID=185979 RepID=UPI0008E4AC4D|nr:MULTISPECIES: transglycosylase domain-containing protein [unclassified Bacillus (in: firmicutes)]SFB17724.1 penicillin-binding protein [Bacillus sp. UNCCL13]SFQ76706.1 penicillin-binding protein [Bacillus sp. cl95]